VSTGIVRIKSIVLNAIDSAINTLSGLIDNTKTKVRTNASTHKIKSFLKQAKNSIKQITTVEGIRQGLTNIKTSL
jgi:hypothetical protein